MPVNKIIFKEGLWSLGKTFDTQNSPGFRLHESSGRSMGHMRYSNPFGFLQTAASLIQSESANQHFEFTYVNDRTPYFLWALAKHRMLSEPIDTFHGRYYNTELEKLLVQYNTDFETMIDQFSKHCGTKDYEVEFQLYRPTDLRAYMKWMIGKDEAWWASKMIGGRNRELMIKLPENTTIDPETPHLYYTLGSILETLHEKFLSLVSDSDKPKVTYTTHYKKLRNDGRQDQIA